MAKGWRKDDYNRQIFGQKVKEYRLTLDYSLGQLAQLSNINKGTLLHVEKGECRLPNGMRQNIIDVLTEALGKIGRPVNRREFLKVAGLTTVSTTLGTMSSPTQHQHVEIPRESSQEKLFQGMSHEEYAELLNQQQEWQQAATSWLLAVQEAKQHHDWTTWSRCLLSAGQMALNAGQFEIAERRFKEVIDTSQNEVGILAVAEAYIRLGWLYYEQDKFSNARQFLLTSRTLLHNLGRNNLRSLHLPEHNFMLVCEGNEAIMALERSRLHWLGRTYVDWGIQQENQTLLEKGVAKLQKAESYDSQLGLYTNVGFALLRQIPALLKEGEFNTTKTYLARSEELLGMRGKGKGHIYLHKGLLVLEEQPKKAIEFLEGARESFAEPPFYSKGLSEVYKEIGGVYLMDDKIAKDQKAVEYALAATVLHPYGRNLEMLQLAAHKLYWRLGENMTAFNTFWQTLKEKIWSMESEPFSDLRYLINSFQEQGIQHVEIAIATAEKAIYAELFSK